MTLPSLATYRPAARNTIEAHPIPPDGSPSGTYSLAVNGAPVPVVQWYGPFAYAHFSFDESAPTQLTLTVPDTIASHAISPRRDNLQASVSGNRLSFSFQGRRYLSIKINDYDQLFIFADRWEQDAPSPEDETVVDIADYVSVTDGSVVSTAAINQAIADVSSTEGKSVLYFGPGEYRSGTILLQSNVTLYLAAGALLKASDDPMHFHRDHPGGTYRRLNFITAYHVENVGIRGRGVIDGNANHLRTVLANRPAYSVVGRPGVVDSNRIINVQFSHAQNAFIEGVFSRNSSSWNTIPHCCTAMTIRHYKVMSDMVWKAYKNEDAIDPDSCAGLTIEDSFFLARDDGIVMKTTGTYKGQAISPDGTARDMHDIILRNNVIWCETAAIKYGYSESETSEIYNLLVEDNVVLLARNGVQLRPLGPAIIRDAIFRRNTYERLEDFNGVARNYWLDAPSAHDIQFQDETHATFGSSDSVIKGTRITFHNISIAGKCHATMDSARFQNQGTAISLTAYGSGSSRSRT